MPESKEPKIYKPVTQFRYGHTICNAGYEDCELGNSYHWHCSKCGGISGQQGHYGNPDGKGWRFMCAEEKEDKSSETSE